MKIVACFLTLGWECYVKEVFIGKGNHKIIHRTRKSFQVSRRAVKTNGNFVGRSFGSGPNRLAEWTVRSSDMDRDADFKSLLTSSRLACLDFLGVRDVSLFLFLCAEEGGRESRGC
ncbi:uncharacterized protein G2W53_008487 [Senna tora]|uniref:Uncharacterized protein n=1 Tax=Senna tora TaxID=362788 RepID=A0A834X8K5_9FABA|nr:uncharacterized protein G2W53_008487 [Senna tora]